MSRDEIVGRETVETIGEFFLRVAPPRNGDQAGRKAQALKMIEEALEHAYAEGASQHEVHEATLKKGPRKRPDGTYANWFEGDPDPEAAAKERGDLGVVWYNILYRAGDTIDDAIGRVMPLNYARQWDCDKDGRAQHKEGTE